MEQKEGEKEPKAKRLIRAFSLGRYTEILPRLLPSNRAKEKRVKSRLL